MDLKEKLTELINDSLKKCNVEYNKFVVERPNNKENGDYSTNVAMELTKVLHKNPREIANELVKIFLEVIAAPEYTQEALDILKTKKNLRVIKFNSKPTNTHGIVSVDGGIMIQSEDVNQKEEFNIVTDVKPTQQQIKDMLFAQKVVKYVKSNAIVVANNGVAVGIGGGQVNRVWPTEGALKRGVGATVLASDAFFPFRDVVDIAAKYGIKAIIQPSGSIRDQESIDACNEHKIAMVFTGVRHFKH